MNKRYIINPETGCWLWIMYILPTGYGQTWANGRVITAHIAEWEKSHGPVLDGKQLDHLCHTRDKSCHDGNRCLHRRCINPDHLEPVERIVNAQRSRAATLTADSIHLIWDAFYESISLGEIADTHATSTDAIRNVLTFKTWSNISIALGMKPAKLHKGQRYWDPWSLTRPGTKISKDLIMIVWQGFEDGVPSEVIAKQLGVHFNTINRILSGRGWRELSIECGFSPSRRAAPVITDGLREQIIQKVFGGVASRRAIAREFGISHTSVNEIFNSRHI